MPATADLLRLDDGTRLLRLCAEVEPFERKVGDVAEQWIQVMPFGPVVTARDGRTFQISDLLKVVALTELPLLIDWEHDSEFGSTRAAGWVEQLEIQDSEGTFPRAGVWGRAVWTDEGGRDVQTRAYRFLSPTLLLDKETRDAIKVLAVALTNRPALTMQGLDTYRETMSARLSGPRPQGGEEAMTPETKRALCSSLGLNPDASDASILEVVSRSRSSIEMCAQLTTDLAAATERATHAEQSLATYERERFERAVDTTLDDLTKAGKLTPAQRADWRVFCLKSADHLEQFTKQVAPGLRPIGDPAPPSPGPTDPRTTTTSGKPIKNFFGLSPQSFDRARAFLAEHTPASDSDWED